MKNTVEIAAILLMSLFFFTICTAQSKLQPEKVINGPGAGKSKMVKTQGSDEYQGVSCGIEDHAGNLWLGTGGEGVYRYDGKLFTQFSIENGLGSNIVSAIYEDKDNNIWVGTKNGLCCFDGNTMTQIPMDLNAAVHSVNQPNQVFCIMQDRKGMLWFGTAAGVFCYDGKVFSEFSAPKTTNDSRRTLKEIQCIFEDKNGNIWFGSGPMAFEGLILYDGKTLTDINLYNENWIRRIYEDDNGKLMLTTRHMGVFTRDETYFMPYPAPKELNTDLLTYMLTDSKGNSWYASDYTDDNDITTGGLWKSHKNSFIAFTKKDGLENTSVSFILEDRKKNIWIGTRNNGLYCFNQNTFVSFCE